MNRILRWLESSLVNNRFPLGFAVAIYVVSFGQNLILGNALFWDDWQNQVSKEEFASNARLSGFPPTREILEFDLLGNSAVLFRIVTFISFFVAAVCLHRVLSRGLSLSNAQVNAITLLFLVVPVNSARAALIIMHYSFSFALFFCAWSLLVSKRIFFQFLALPIFWISFGTPSLLPFFVLPVAHWVVVNANRIRELPIFFFAALLTVTPVSYWIIRAQTFGSEVREYYVPRPLGVVRGGLLVLVALAVLIHGLLRRSWSLNSQSQPFLAALGFMSVALGASSYMAGGHLVDISDWLISFVPNFSDWDSRHQLLLGLGISAVICATLIDPSEIKVSPGRLKTFSAVLCTFCILNFTFAQEYYLDSLKQDQVLAALKEVKGLKTVNAILVDDQAPRFNARGRSLRSYEWSQMIKSSLEREEPIVVEPLRFVNCQEFKPEMMIRISAQNGRLESLLTRNLGITVTATEIDPCN